MDQRRRFALLLFALAACQPDWSSKPDAGGDSTGDPERDAESRGPSRRDGGRDGEETLEDGGETENGEVIAANDAGSVTPGPALSEPGDAGSKPAEPPKPMEMKPPEPEPEPESPMASDAGKPPTVTDAGKPPAPPSCDTMTCGAHATCEPSSASCKCDEGYALGLFNTCDDINECLNPLFCSGGKQCMNTQGSASCSCGTPSWSYNLLLDPGFEGVPATWNLNWIGDFSEANTAEWKQSMPGHAGAQGIRVTSLTPGVWSGVYQVITLKPNTTYRLGAWARASVAKPNIRIGAKTEANEVIGTSAAWGSMSWLQSQITFKTGAGGKTYVLFGIWGVSALDWAEFDDVSLEELTSPPCE